jgi:L-malate glycosyltransferase
MTPPSEITVQAQQTNPATIRSRASANRPLRVFHLIETFEIGGTETQAVQTVLRQRSMGGEITLGCLREEGPLLTLLHEAGIPVVEFRKEKKLFSMQGIRQMFRLALFLRRQRFDVLHAHDLPSNLLGVPAARLAGTPIVISSRRYLDLEWWYGKWRNRIAARMYNFSTYVLVNSKSVCDLLLTRDGVRPEKIRVIYNGIDVDKFNRVHRGSERSLSLIQPHSQLVAVVANMESPIKGHASLISAADTVCRDFPDLVFMLIGDGRERPKLQQQIKQAGLENNFLFLGSRRDVPELLACCDISVLTSESEGFPNAVLEAMAARLPVIATSVGGVPEVIENEVTGLLVAPGNPTAISAAILRLLNDQDLCRRLADAGHERVVERFSFGRLINSLESLYRGSLEALPGICGQPQSFHSLAASASFANQVNE